MSGLLIAIEGIDGSGKSTLARCLKEQLEPLFSRIVLTKEPGGTHNGKAIRELLQYPPHEPWGSRAELLLFAADRAHHFENFVLPELAHGSLVISDRMADSSLAYQGYGRGLDLTTITMLNAYAMHNRVPDYVLYLDLPVEIAFQRLSQRATHPTAFEREQRAFWERVQTGFEEIFKNRTNVIRLDGTKTAQEVCEQAVTLLLPHIKPS